jgi:MoaA/NifB/PqqE/SkfB family radical SAM enzyme
MCSRGDRAVSCGIVTDRADSRGAHRNRVIWVLNSACPSRCVYCDIESQHATRGLSTDEVTAACRDIVAAGFREVIFVGGEPLLSPELPAALAALDGQCEVAIFTGGVPGFTARAIERMRRGVRRLVFSIDSGRDADNDLVRGRKGITHDLLEMVEAVRRDLPFIDISLNTVVSRHNVEILDTVWDRLRAHRPSSWALTLVGDNFTGSPGAHLPSRAQIEHLYLTTVPALARRLAADRAELVVLPVPFPLLSARTPPAAWGDRASAPDVRAAIDLELDRFAVGDYNRTFVENHGCPLVGVDVSIGVGGEVHPCSQAPILQREYVVGNVKNARLGDILAGEAVTAFSRAVPHAPCTRCWAPSNVDRDRLVQVLRGAKPPRRVAP